MILLICDVGAAIFYSDQNYDQSEEHTRGETPTSLQWNI